MTVLCALELESGPRPRQAGAPPNAADLAGVAAVIASKLGLPLVLLHVDRGAPNARHQLLEVAVFARGICKDVEEELVTGPAASHPERAIVEAARRRRPTLVVAGSGVRRGPAHWLNESVSERLVRTSPVPVWLVKDSLALAAWLRGERALNVVVAADLDPSGAFVPWFPLLERIGRCDPTIVHVAWPPSLHDRYGYHEDMALDRLPDELTRRATHDLRDASRSAGVPEGAKVVVEPGFGRPDHHLAVIASHVHADLILTGGHRRSGFTASWQASFTRGILRAARQSILSVPVDREEAHATPGVRSVLAATDFSDAGDRACRQAFGLLPSGGTVHLLHVCARSAGVADDSQRRTTIETSRRHLESLVPPDATARALDVEAHVAEGEPAAEIARVAEAVGADVVCVGAGARASGLVGRIVGSTSAALLERCSKPVLVVR